MKKLREYLSILNTAVIILILLAVSFVIYYDRAKYISTIEHWVGKLSIRGERVSNILATPNSAEPPAPTTAPSSDTQGNETTSQRGNSVPPGNWSTAIEDFQLIVDPEDLKRLDALSERLKEKGVMTDSDKMLVKSLFIAKGGAFEAKLRMRGDLSAHWGHAKKSWRLKINKSSPSPGYRELNFVIPLDKAYEIEAVAYNKARQLGLLVPDHGWARMKLNSTNYGLYFWYEQYGAEMLERLGYPAGEIFGEDDVWLDNRFTGFGINTNWDQYASSYNRYVAAPSHAGEIEQRFQEVMELTRQKDFGKFSRDIVHYVNIEKFATYSALMWMFGSAHSQQSDNIKLYYNSTTGLIEPITYDVSLYSLGNWNGNIRENGPLNHFDSGAIQLVDRLMRVQEISQRRNELLWDLVNNPDFDLASAAKQEYNLIRPYLGSGVDSLPLPALDGPHQQRLEILRANRRTLKEWIRYARLFADVRVKQKGTSAVLEFQLHPDSMNALEITGIDLPLPLADSASAIRATLSSLRSPSVTPIKVGVVPSSDNRTHLEFSDTKVWTARDASLDYVTSSWALALEIPHSDAQTLARKINAGKIKLGVRNTGTGEDLLDERIRITPAAYSDSESAAASYPNDVDQFIASSGLPFSKDGNNLSLGPGLHELRESLILPKGYGLKLATGAELALGENVSILVHGPANFIGTESRPVVIRALSPNKPWGTLAFVSSKAPSTVRHLSISQGSEAWLLGMYFSGQFSFHGSSLLIEDSVISGATADDALNVKNASVTINRTRFIKNKSDGFDGDWVEGKIFQSTFLLNGGDGVDVSGSRLIVENSFLSGMADKAISVGEKSTLLAINSQIEKSDIGVASKDNSVFEAYGVNFFENRLAVSAYQKKRIHGPGIAHVYGSVFLNNSEDAVAEDRSRVVLTGCARSKRDTTANVTVESPKVGNVERYYKPNEDGLLLYENPSGDDVPFARGPDTKRRSFLGTEIKPLMGAPVGLIDPFTPLL